ncbi:MAG TPA: MarR family transcriptional regulator [Actinomycetota bacterium]|nr:MarR family transcriptional regulator [Actinomycetota bacterium]
MESFLGRQLAVTHKAVRAEFDARLAEAGGSLSTWIVLRSAGESMSQRELADRMGVEGPTLVRHLDRLEREGLIGRHRDPLDRRVTRIRVTLAGEAMLARLAAVAAEFERELRSALGDLEYTAMMAALKQVHAFAGRLAGERKAHAHAAH